jgi:hypothetical protein
MKKLGETREEINRGGINGVEMAKAKAENDKCFLAVKQAAKKEGGSRRKASGRQK